MSRPRSRAVYGAVALACVLTATACGPDHASGGGGPRASAGAPTRATAAPAAPAKAYVLTTPPRIGAYPRYRMTADQQRMLAQALAGQTRALGISGTQISAVYEDKADQLYAVFAGLNGSGFDPATLHAKLWRPPQTQVVGTARMTSSWEDTDPGPHGGAAICNQTLGQSGMIAAEGTSCSWMSTTTFGVVFLRQPRGARQIFYNQTAANIGPIMRKIRAAVERRQ
ncbi:hypothetical protein [Actinoallomurus rhizosphaericola]|uniref:hypothetical protein n=1 Tax=Actinoallomurus rhizosphaericola TaxID=2952536 RepID=UPI0020925603|nr:hypothetical protein [Actinoallomurus rhizosphaericola]MCO5998528.1 hypothetical protein [Actinoallomurus rhizosphaericola]